MQCRRCRPLHEYWLHSSLSWVRAQCRSISYGYWRFSSVFAGQQDFGILLLRVPHGQRREKVLLLSAGEHVSRQPSLSRERRYVSSFKRSSRTRHNISVAKIHEQTSDNAACPSTRKAAERASIIL